MKRCHLVRLIVCVCILPTILGMSPFPPSSAQTRSADYSHFDVLLSVLENGSFNVVETQTVNFVGGPFTQGFRSVPLRRTSGVQDIAVYELVADEIVKYSESDSTKDNTFEVLRMYDEIVIRWYFSPTSDEVRTFVIEYKLVNALRYYPAANPPNQQVWYIPIGGALTSEIPVFAGSFTLEFPRPINPDSLMLTVDGMTVTNVDDFTDDYQTFVFKHGAFDRGESWEIHLQSNVVAVEAVVPPWQEADDDNRRVSTAKPATPVSRP